MRVAILHYASFPVIGGVESIVTTHARLLAREGHSPFVVTGRGDPAAAGLEGVVMPELDSRHPEIHAVQQALLRGEDWALPEFGRWVTHIYDLLGRALEDAGVCIVHNAFTLHKNLALSAALARLAEHDSHEQRPRRWIAWCHDLAWNNPLYRDELLPGWPWTVLKTRLPNVTYVAISEERRQEMAALFGVSPESIVLVPNGIEPTGLIPCSAQMVELREQTGWDRRDWVFLAPVRVTRRKNLELALDITAAVRAKGRRPLLVVTGPPGPHNPRSADYLQELLDQRETLGLQDEVRFLSVEGDQGRPMNVSDSLMNELYWWADALLLPSVQEGFGLPILEAGLARLPAFCSDIPVLREVGGNNAHYFRPGDDPATIAQAILAALESPGVASMRRKVLATYTWEAIFRARLLPLLDHDRPTDST